ncbi:alpha-amylase family protein [Tessaracoccus sp. Z1128]
MGLMEHAIWWQVYPLGATGAPIRGEHGEPAHRLTRLEAWLDYLVELGCNGLLLGPVFESVSHGYDTLDHFRIDPRLGDDADFDRLIAEGRARGIHLMLDGVFNHVAREHRLVTERPELIRHRDGHPQGWEGHESLVELDHDNPAVLDLVSDAMLHWLRRGIAGWRLDVAYAVPTRFWRDVAARVRAEFPDAVLLGEVIHGDYAGFIRESTLSSVTQYELWKAVWSSFKDANLWELAHALERHAGFCGEFLPQIFVGNHDVTRIATILGAPRAALAATVLMTLPGMPSIYYGDEQGFTGTKTEAWHGDDEVRPPLPASPAELSPLGESMHRTYQSAIAFRRRHPWLAGSSVEVLQRDNTALTYRCHGGAEEAEFRLDLAAASLTVRQGDAVTVLA